MNTADKVAHFAQDAADTLSSAGHQARETFDEKGEQLKNTEQRLMKNCQAYIRDNPVTSLGIAVATGFLLSRLLSSR